MPIVKNVTERNIFIFKPEMKILSAPQKVFLALFLGLVFLYSFNQLKESDAFYHLKAGQLIWETKSIPHQDVFSYTASGRTWIAHEWLGELIFYGAYKAGGFWGLISFIAFFAALTYFLIFLLALKKGAEPNLTLLLMFILGYLTFELWIPRPQIFSFFCLALLVYLLESYRLEEKKIYLWLSALTIWFWANVNASFILGIVVVFFYFISEILKIFFPFALGRPAEIRKTVPIGIMAATGLFLSFINPNGYKIFLYSSYIKPVVKMLQIMEWKPIYVFWYEIQTKIFLAGMLAVAVIVVYWLWFREENRDSTWPGAVLGIFLLPFISIRHVGFLPIIAAAPCAVALSGISRKFLDFFSERFFKIIIPSIFIIFAILRYPDFSRAPLNTKTLPIHLADFITEKRIKGPLFNLYNEGGYLIWRFWPGEKVFIDGRSEVYGGMPISDLFKIVGRLKDWQKLVDEKYGINYFILPYYPESLSKDTGALAEELYKDNFHLVYWDDNAVLLVRRTVENSKIIQEYELKHISPFRIPESIPANESKAAAKELQGILLNSPDSSIIKEYVRRFLGVPLDEKKSSF